MKDIDEITADVINVALRIHRDLGPGLLESVYETVLAHDSPVQASMIDGRWVIPPP